MKKYLRILLGVVIVILIVSYFAIGYAIKNILAYSAIRPSRITKEIIAKNFGNIINPSSKGLKYTDFYITVEDTIKLKGWFINSQRTPSKGTIFLLHGIAGCKNAMLPLAKILCEVGFNCVCYDSRANGESGGLNCTFGYYEKKDLSKYIDSIIVRFPDSGPYGIWGHSLGAAVTIQAMAEDKRLVCGIAVSPFADLRNIIHDYFARIFLFRINIIPDKALEYSEQIAHFKVDSVRPVISAKNITQPTMIIHGLKDERIASTNGKMIFENLSAKEKIWYPIENGNHNNIPEIAGAHYYSQVKEFFEKYLK
jgi:uncharacterized protein